MNREDRVARRMARREYRDSRAQKIIDLRCGGMTYAAIGQAMIPPLTRERVRQILVRHGGADLLGCKATTHNGKPKRQPAKCPHCDTLISDSAKACRLHWERSGVRDAAALKLFVETVLAQRAAGATWQAIGLAMGSTERSKRGFQTKFLRRLGVAKRHGIVV